MSVQAHIFVATDANVENYDTNPSAFQEESAQWQRITPMELSTLWALIKNREWADEVLDPFYPEIWVSENGQRAISKLPQDFLADVQAVDEPALAGLVDQWAATDELKCPPRELLPVVNDLRRLAQLALQPHRNVYLWNFSEDADVDSADNSAADQEFLVTRNTPAVRLILGGILVLFSWSIYLARITLGTGPMHDYQGHQAPVQHYLIGAAVITGFVALWIASQAIAARRRARGR